MKKLVINIVLATLIFIASYNLIKGLCLFVAIFGFVSGVAFATPNYGDSAQELFDMRTELSAFLSFVFLSIRLINKK